MSGAVGPTEIALTEPAGPMAATARLSQPELVP